MLEALRALRFEVWAWRVSRSGQSRLARTRAGSLRVHLGCGADVRDGWLNIDLQKRRAAEHYVNFDLRRGLPLPPASCSVIYSSHFIEHLSLAQCRRLFEDCFRVLEPGGMLRLSLPDFRRLTAEYVAGNSAYFEPLAEYCGVQPTLAGYMNYVLYQFGEHRSFHDPDSFRYELERVGFRAVTTTDFDPAFDPTDAMRRRYSMYVIATRP